MYYSSYIKSRKKADLDYTKSSDHLPLEDEVWLEMDMKLSGVVELFYKSLGMVLTWVHIFVIIP
jgi:hypothetical protein